MVKKLKARMSGLSCLVEVAVSKPRPKELPLLALHA